MKSEQQEHAFERKDWWICIGDVRTQLHFHSILRNRLMGFQTEQSKDGLTGTTDKAGATD